MISRVAEGCFWLTRYLERVDIVARLLDVHHSLHIDAGIPIERRWRVLVDFTGQEDDFRARIGAGSLDDGEAVQHYLTWDEEHPSSLTSVLRRTRENARSVREIMSVEAWETINDLWLWLRGADARRLYAQDRGGFYERLMTSAVLFHGVSFATMLHDEPFSFMKLGRAVERAGQTARIMDTHGDFGASEPGGSAEAARWLAVLRCCCAYEPFFRSGMHPLGGPTVTSFLLFDRALPRSVLYNLDEARRLLFALRLGDPVGLPRRSRSALERLRGELLQMSGEDVQRRGVHETLAWLVAATDQLCEAIHDDYLAPPMPWLRHCVRALESVDAAPERDEASRVDARSRRRNSSVRVSYEMRVP
jgi:uncharacterized alpha-E superfamily protein